MVWTNNMSSARISATAALVLLATPGFSESVAGPDVLSRIDKSATSRRYFADCSSTDDALDPVKVWKSIQGQES